MASFDISPEPGIISNLNRATFQARIFAHTTYMEQHFILAEAKLEIFELPPSVNITGPPGWTRRVTRRKSGKQKGKLKTAIFSPTGERFATKTKLKNFTFDMIKF